MVESCLSPQKTRQVFESALKKSLVLGFRFFVSDVVSGEGYWAQGPNH